MTRGMQAMHFNEHEAYGEVWCHGRTEVGIRNGVTCREEKRCGCLRGLDTPAEALVKLRLCSGQEGHGSLNNGCYRFFLPRCAGVRDKEGLIFCKSCTWRALEDGMELPEHADPAVVAEVTEELRRAGKLPGQ